MNKYNINDIVYIVLAREHKVLALKVADISQDSDETYKYNLIHENSTTIKHPRNKYSECHIYKTRKEAEEYLLSKDK